MHHGNGFTVLNIITLLMVAAAGPEKRLHSKAEPQLLSYFLFETRPRIANIMQFSGKNSGTKIT